LVAGQTATATVFLTSITGGQGRLDAWIDWNQNGSWNDPGDQIFTNTALNPGTNALNFSVPAAASNGTSFARFRLSRPGGLRPTGPAQDGEVEDYRVTVQTATLDFGDAPQQYPTFLAQNGARHTVVPNLRLGTNIDAEPDGLANVAANGDDTTPAAGPDDEDGVIFTSTLVAGQTATVTVNVTAGGLPAGPRLFAWIDFNANGSWADAGEQIFAGIVVNNGANNLNFSVPATAQVGLTYARFRLTAQTALGFNGPADSGEVEDYDVRIQASPLDFGDAPQQYPTLLSNNGARHTIVTGLRLGTNIDAEPDGLPSGAATGDDLAPAAGPDDEDGVTFISALVAGQTATVQVNVFFTGGAGAARLFAWIDFNNDGSWDDAGEQIFNATAVNNGLNTLTFAVPATAAGGATYARFRLTTLTTLSFDGVAQNGEVEDYLVNVQAALDYGDAPQPYPTLLAQNGARHTIIPNFRLGTNIDAEPDGLADATATGDDATPAAGPDDEDGVQLSALQPGASASAIVRVTMAVGTTARLDAWIDFNRDGDWADSGEQIFVSVAVIPGDNTLGFPVPLSAVEGPTYARFRLSRQGGLSFIGLAPDGEVEDYSPRITQRPPQDECSGTCKGTDFWLTFPANYAPDPDNPLNLTLCVMGTPGTKVTVNFAASGFPLDVTIPASMSAIVNLPVTADLGETIDVVEDKAVHVTATAPVSVHAESHARYTTDGYLALPSAVLGRAYVVQGFANVFGGAADLNGSQFAIAACEPDTTVSIRPSVAAAGHSANVVYSITLQQGQTYQLRAAADTPADLSGTIIVADKPIGVFGSHRCANIPSSNVFFCDFIVEQLLPVTTWSMNYVTFPLATRSNGDTFRSQAAFDNTRLFFNGILVATLDQGESYQAQRTAGTHITADKPISVMQYANSADFDVQPFNQGDPFMVIVPPISMFASNHMVCTAPVDFTSYLNVIAPAGAVASVRVDGAPVGVVFTPIAASGYSGAQIPVLPGPHQVTASQPIGVTVYGWAEYDSYGWPGCLAFGDFTPPTMTCSISNATVTVTPGTAGGCVGQVPDFREGTQVTDNCSPRSGIRIEQDPPPGTPVPGGTHVVRVIATDERGNASSCVITLRVLDPSDPQIFCPSNVVANCTSPAGAVVTYNVPAMTQCGTSLAVQCSPPPGSLFPPGATLVTCRATNDFGKLAICEFPVEVRCTGIQRAPNGRLNVTWTGGGALETTDVIGGRWTRLSNASPYSVTLDERQRFFRVRYE
jgi:hypothetical protein